jgi:ribonuclease P protein component
VTLKKRREFLWVRGGRRWGVPGFALEARARQPAKPNMGAEPADAPMPPRFGYTVSKKVGGAVVRNRVRRRLRALTAALDPATLTPGFDYVLIARPAAAERSFADLKNDLDQALTRVHQQQGQKRRAQAKA